MSSTNGYRCTAATGACPECREPSHPAATVTKCEVRGLAMWTASGEGAPETLLRDELHALRCSCY